MGCVFGFFGRCVETGSDPFWRILYQGEEKKNCFCYHVVPPPSPP